MWPKPLSQMLQQRYSHPFATSTGWTVAHPTSVLQNQSVVSGVDFALQASMCGSYQSASDAAVRVSPGKPSTPYGPSDTMQVGLGQCA